MERRPKGLLTVLRPYTAKAEDAENNVDTRFMNFQGHPRTKTDFQNGAERTYWTNTYILDLSNAYLALVEAAVEHVGKAIWGKEGYYNTFPKMADIEVSEVVASAARQQSFLTTDEIVTMPDEEATGLTWLGSAM